MSGVILTAAVALPPEANLEVEAGKVVRRPRRLDGICQAGVAVVARMLPAAGLDPAELGEHALVVGTALGCLESDAAYYRQVVDRGLSETNPRLFAYTLPNVVIGEVAIASGLTGENLLFCAGRASGLTALGEAAALLVDADLDTALVLVLDVVGPATAEVFGALGTRPTPIAAGFVLEREARVVARGAPVLGRVKAFAAGFDPQAARPAPDPDPLGAAGVGALLEALQADGRLRGGRFEARCSAGYTAHLDLAPPDPCVDGETVYFPASWSTSGGVGGASPVPVADIERFLLSRGVPGTTLRDFMVRAPIHPGDRVQVCWDGDAVTLEREGEVCAMGRLESS